MLSRALPLALLVVLGAQSGAQTNLLTDSGFEIGVFTGGSTAPSNGWFNFANSFVETASSSAIPRTGTKVAKLFGNFSVPFNVSGFFESYAAAPADTYEMDCWSRHNSGDAMTGLGQPNDSFCIMKIAFFDANGNEIAGTEGVILDGTSPTDTWIDNTPIQAIAPLGTVEVQALILFLQAPVAGMPNMFQSGAAFVDDVEFRLIPPTPSTYPGSFEDLTMNTGLNGASATTGPGADIKTVAPGDFLEVRVGSPAQSLVQQPYFLLAQVFATGTPPNSPAGFPEVHVDPGAGVSVLVNGSAVGLFGFSNLIGPGQGSSTYYVMPTGFPPGVSVMLQALITPFGMVSPGPVNNFFFISDGHELQF
ncbi:MAG: hypothetical protein KDB53_14815 [Planctomycetes bacterium]|nr:hypothetical protein [Planctomycetota bacterium]